MNSTVQSLLRSFFFLFIALTILTPVGEAQAQTPWEDTGFSPTTPRPDPDLVVVRERFYGAEGVDLTAYGIGTGPVDFVQSVYFRFFVDLEAGTYDSYIARVEFPSNVTILGIITDEVELGGSEDDGILTETDAIFGIPVDPDSYSGQFRGFEQLGGEGTSEFVSLANGDNALVFGVNVEEGMDDFRVIVDYGSSFPPDVAFDVRSYRVGQLGGAVPERGVLVGDDFNPLVFGSGDFGEAGSVYGIPLTSIVEPTTGGSLPFDPLANIFILRDQDLARPTLVDGFDVELALPAPDLHTYDSVAMRTPSGITDGKDGNLYSVSEGFGLAITPPGSTGTVETELEVLPGVCVDVTNLPGNDDLFLLRDQDGGDTFVDRLELTGYTFTDHIALTGTDVTEPVAVIDYPDGKLFVVDANGGFASVMASTGAMFTDTVALPDGNWVDATNVGDKIYLLRERAGGVHTIDLFDPIYMTVTDFGLVDVTHADSPAAITDGPNGWLYVVSEAPDIPLTISVIDPWAAEIIHLYDYLHFPGFNVSVTNLAPAVSAVRDGGLPTAGVLPTSASPNPFNPRVEIKYALDRDALVRVAIYDIHGRLVRTLHNGRQPAGERSVTWEGRDRHGRDMPSGTYLYRVDTGETVGMGKITLAK